MVSKCALFLAYLSCSTLLAESDKSAATGAPDACGTEEDAPKDEHRLLQESAKATLRRQLKDRASDARRQRSATDEGVRQVEGALDGKSSVDPIQQIEQMLNPKKWFSSSQNAAAPTPPAPTTTPSASTQEKQTKQAQTERDNKASSQERQAKQKKTEKDNKASAQERTSKSEAKKKQTDKEKNQKKQTTTTTAPPAPTTAPAQYFSSPQVSPITGTSYRRMEAIEWQVMLEVNKHRKAGFTCPDGTVFPPRALDTVVDCRLWWSAKLHDEDMAKRNYYSHYTLGAQPSEDAFARTARTAWNMGSKVEVIAGFPSGVQNDAKPAVDAWLKSQAHCMGMGHEWNHLIGPAYAPCRDGNCQYEYYWTALFAWTRDSVPAEYRTAVPEYGLDTSCYPLNHATLR